MKIWCASARNVSGGGHILMLIDKWNAPILLIKLRLTPGLNIVGGAEKTGQCSGWRGRRIVLERACMCVHSRTHALLQSFQDTYFVTDYRRVCSCLSVTGSLLTALHPSNISYLHCFTSSSLLLLNPWLKAWKHSKQIRVSYQCRWCLLHTGEVLMNDGRQK